MNPNETTATNGSPLEMLKKYHPEDRYIGIGLATIGLGTLVYVRFAGIFLNGYEADGLFVLLGLMTFLMGVHFVFQRRVDYYLWWKNITDEDYAQVRQIVEETLSVAESGEVMNHDQKTVLDYLQQNATKSYVAGRWPTPTHKSLGVRALKIAANEAEKLPTKK